MDWGQVVDYISHVSVLQNSNGVLLENWFIPVKIKCFEANGQ